MTVTVPDRITPDLVRRATEALAAHGCTIQRHKTGSAGLGQDPTSAPAYTVRRDLRVWPAVHAASQRTAFDPHVQRSGMQGMSRR